ncbi:N-acetylmuramoyl-L-alanine amidase [Xanthomonas euvesicatoria pv. eucalypti]|uniref:N-acetylmuramoyl-L-alanine amidase n=1 Tax=Xanthomonas euvesicatoria TaxID=456327 RepID=UPI0026E184B0|nr:N-acetylmuramoyl-L-alanine amidase [Xanthomonas euvesicatoria]MDO7931603.1 N-acetylmuramoyl-L-alanine amidase [Xanthomonas euvesicatoria pv. eucalypti]MDO7941842.1 N-acetylmuramoyl-L-alanine amidase [Xanthomonas euvesicatoria pv. eucalypti]MDO7944810.1 N-acetylmuramoyl-L-alanine amidase [Xanthomonas euvesicatoria pv. eucalypti]MDO7947981.1 N-acetylmuramoyl-L-alanine amidase [Xanthomonas euvesicatoria pv. eucalypti]MDO7953872.1 N-acetylmuramoyl-L-alanine amidase [Xanthomonas euvesicatoria pv
MTPGIRQFFLSALTASLSLAVFAAWGGEIKGVGVSTGATGTRAEIQLAGSGGFKTLSLANPTRLVVDFPESSGMRGLKLPSAAGLVTSVRTGQPVPGTFRVVFELATPVTPLKPQMQTLGSVSTLVIEWPGDPAPAAASAVAAAALTAAPAPRPLNAQAEAARATAALAASAQRASSVPPSQPSTPPPAPSVPASALPTVTQAPVPTTVATGVPTPRPATSGAPAPTGVAGNTPNRAAGAAANVTSGAVVAGSSASAAAILNGGSAPMGATSGNAAANAPNSASSAVAAAGDDDLPPRPVLPSEASRVKMAPGMRPLIVAIDPGHGGQDPGAMGPTGKREKDVTLAVGRELARQVNATPGMKAYLTRDTDVFIPLPMRAQKARAAKADIFISIHADAAENRSATGSSVYVLSTKGASSQRARWLADKENAADLVGGVRLQQTESTLANVLLDLAQSGHMKASEDAAGHVLGGLKRIGNNHKPQLERANFAVLRTSDMPAMLVETAFISNPDEERRLIDPAYQRKIAGAVLDGIDTFFTRQPPPGTLFAARAQAEADAVGTVAGGSR